MRKGGEVFLHYLQLKDIESYTYSIAHIFLGIFSILFYTIILQEEKWKNCLCWWFFTRIFAQSDLGSVKATWNLDDLNIPIHDDLKIRNYDVFLDKDENITSIDIYCKK